MLLVINVKRSVCCANKSTAATAETSSPTLVTTGLLDISDGLTKAATKFSLNRNNVLA